MRLNQHLYSWILLYRLAFEYCLDVKNALLLLQYSIGFGSLNLLITVARLDEGKIRLFWLCLVHSAWWPLGGKDQLFHSWDLSKALDSSLNILVINNQPTERRNKFWHMYFT